MNLQKLWQTGSTGRVKIPLSVMLYHRGKVGNVYHASCIEKQTFGWA